MYFACFDTGYTGPDPAFKKRGPKAQKVQKHFVTLMGYDTQGLFSSEIESMVRLASNTATVVTTIIPLAGSSTRYSNRLLMKTLYVTVVNHRTRAVIIKEGDRIYPDSGDRSRYLLIPQDGVLSKSAELFNQEIHMVGRTCWAHHSINASTSPSSDPVFQTFTIRIPGNMTITESCPKEENWITTNWTISSLTRLELPITCKLTFEKFNCSSV